MANVIENCLLFFILPLTVDLDTEARYKGERKEGVFPNFAKYLLCLPTGLLGRYRHTLTRHPPDLADTLMIVMMMARITIGHIRTYIDQIPPPTPDTVVSSS